MNAKLRELYPDSEELFDVVLMTSNHAHVGLRLINSINHHSKLKKTCKGKLSLDNPIHLDLLSEYASAQIACLFTWIYNLNVNMSKHK